MVQRAQNCKEYTSSVSVFVSGHATSGEGPSDPKCRVDLPVYFSCQKSNYESADASTQQELRQRAVHLLQDKGCDVSDVRLHLNTNLVGASGKDLSAEELLDGGKASNCFMKQSGNFEMTHRAEAKCHPMYDFKDSSGQYKRNTNLKAVSMLSTCETNDDAMPQLEEDLRKVAALMLKKKGYTLDTPEHLACDYSIMPVS